MARRNQLEYIGPNHGYLMGLPASKEQIPRMRALGTIRNWRCRFTTPYLDMNCLSCHRPEIISFSGLDLRYSRTNLFLWSVYKATLPLGEVRAARGVLIIKPGDQKKSILMLRLRSTDPSIRMPIVGRGLMHEEGVELIRQWISEVKYPKWRPIKTGWIKNEKPKRWKCPNEFQPTNR
ncbi:MAG: hypothetical protein R3C56_36095 [Pirellulaceae bacterium]